MDICVPLANYFVVQQKTNATLYSNHTSKKIYCWKKKDSRLGDNSSKSRWPVIKSGVNFKGSGGFEGGRKIIELQVQQDTFPTLEPLGYSLPSIPTLRSENGGGAGMTST